MLDYCGQVRSENLLGAGLDVIRRLKKKSSSGLMDGSAHDLLFCLQTLNLIDIGEAVLTSAYDRKETRGLHVRVDYTLTDPLLNNKLHLVKLVDGQPATTWIEVE